MMDGQGLLLYFDMLDFLSIKIKKNKLSQTGCN